jgi:REP element-mobilizing transposase RayT
MDYDHNGHAKYLWMYHVIFVVKYRKQLLTTFAQEIKPIFIDSADQSDFVILEMEVSRPLFIFW